MKQGGFIKRGKGLRRVGKRGKINLEANKKISQMFTRMGIAKCEVCGSAFGLSPHHKHHRYWYYKQPELLSDFNEVILLCAEHHNEYEPDSTETYKLFNQLR